MEEFATLERLPKTGPSAQKLSTRARREARWGLLFVSPWVLGFLAFILIPLAATFVFTFLDLRMTDGTIGEAEFVGLQNYQAVINDGQAWEALGNTARFGLIALPVAFFLPLLLALLLNSEKLRAKYLFRSLFYLPYLLPFVAAVLLWSGILDPETGWVNQALARLGVQDLPGWLYDADWAYPAYVLMGIWGAGNAMLAMLSGLQGVPADLYDAARVDGAGWLGSFWYISLPMISPVIFYNLILSVVGLFQYFLAPLVVNGGSGEPGGMTLFFNLYVFKTFFTAQNLSYGATLAWVLFLIILAAAVALFATSKYWVHYAGDHE